MEERSDDRSGAHRRVSREAAEDAVDGRGAEGVLTLVCLTCGSEYFFTDEEPDPDLACGKCEGTVFRSYFTHEEGDEADEEFRTETERDLDPDDAEGDALPGDLLDLDDIRS